ncbi:universal stress protein [Winogradskyella ludwigii]|jgi:nucleotide-binding universal stress UspA family protein|uniref:universal stress protein n=1 Tax=Winogradskyella ludwigii TaxID=2686076 RepID=UPI0015CC6BE2|nr:universal stress protein [Winogradskyella ludwigii]
MRHHILLPTDFSKNAKSAASYAFKLFKNETCTFYFLHTWMFPSSVSRTYVTSTYVDNLKKESQDKLNALKLDAKAENVNTKHNFKTIFSSDPLQDNIKSAIKEYAIEMVIMGTKGASGVGEFLFGSNTVTVINKIRLCPILVVPKDFEYVTPKQIGFPTDFNRFYGEELRPIKNLSKLHNSKIRICHINEKTNLTEKQNYNLAMLKAYLEDYKHSFHWMKDYDNKDHAIKDFIKTFNIDILTMINYKHSFIEDLTKEPIIKKMGFHPVVPFLVIPCFG